MEVRTNIITHSKDLPELCKGTFFHSRDLFCMLEQTPRLKPCMVVATDENGETIGELTARFIAAMNEVTGNMETALKESSKVLAVKGRVLPASNEHVRLDALMTDGTVVEGESHIPEAHKQIRRVSLHPRHAAPVQSALDAILNADIILLGPGSLYTSIMPNLLVDGVADALRQSRAIKVYICNVMTQPGETDGYTASRHVKAILDHAGKGVVDYVLVNAAKVPSQTAQAYAAQGSYPVPVDDAALNQLGVGVISADIVSATDPGHHDPGKLTRQVMELLETLRSSESTGHSFTLVPR